MIKFLPLDFLSVSHSTPWKNKNAVYGLQISALVPEILKFEKWVKYANEMTDDIIHSTQYYTEYINRAILANLLCKTLKLGRLIVLQETHLWLQKILFPWQLTLFQSPPTWFQNVGDFQLENIKQGHKVKLTYFRLAGSCIWSAVSKYQNGDTKGGQKSF